MWESDQTLPHRVLEKFNGKRFFFDESKGCEAGQNPSTALGVTAYTPEELTHIVPQEEAPRDRPWASLIALNATKKWFCSKELSEDVNTIWTEIFNLGMLGVTITEDFQRWSHETLGTSGNLPNGWDNQISDGGEPTFMYGY